MKSQDILNQLSCHYPLATSSLTYGHYKNNISNLGRFIEKENNISFQPYPKGVERELVVLYKTSAGECVAYQLSGKPIYTRDKRSSTPFNYHGLHEFSPCIITADGIVLRELNFEDIWNLFSRLTEVDNYLVFCVAALFFKVGRLYAHIPVETNLECIYFDRRQNEEHTHKAASFSKLEIECDVLSTLDDLIGEISIDADYAISFEAFLYFWELQFMKEDICANYLERSREPRRIATSNVVLLYANYFSGQLSTGKLLQRVSLSCGNLILAPDEVSAATKNAIQISDRTHDLFEFIQANGIQVFQSVKLNINGKVCNTIFQIPAAQIYIVRFLSPEMGNYFQAINWKVYTVHQLEEPTIFADIIKSLKEL